MVLLVDDENATNLVEPGRLSFLLGRAFERSKCSGVAVALRCRGGSAYASLASDGNPVAEARVAMPIGCVAKLLTAALAKRAFAARLLAPEDAVQHWLHANQLRDVTLRHLLEHTHGLDDSQLDVIPFAPDGLVDAERIVRVTSARARIAAPGTVYSYGSAGAGLMAAALEKRLDTPYEQLLREELFAPNGIVAARGRSTPRPAICPATGGGLALGATDLLRVLEQAALTRDEIWPHDDRPGTFGMITPLPGWNPLEHGVYLGWKYCGRGWFGHQSVWPAASIFVRVHPERGIGLVVTSRDQAAPIVASRLVGSALPELFDVRMPLRGTTVDLDACAGRYASAAWSVDVEVARRRLELIARRQDASEARVQRVALRPAAGGLFFAQGASLDAFAYVQFVAGHRARLNAYLWNGRFLLPRLS